MIRTLVVCLLFTLIAVPLLAQMPNGQHFNLNIIGVQKGKTAPMTGSDRHSIFVALGNSGKRNAPETVTTDIWLTPGPDFQVCDGNGFDPATDCAGNAIKVNDTAMPGAVFMLPCNTNISSTGGEEIIPCSAGDKASYEVWARELGTPGGSAKMTTCAYETDDTGQQVRICSLENVVLARASSKPVFREVTSELTSLLLEVDGVKYRYALFSGDFEDWVWQYDNTGLKLAQIRLYPN